VSYWDEFRPRIQEYWGPRGVVARWDLTIRRLLVCVLVPIGLYFYSPNTAAIAVIPCSVAFVFLLRNAWRRFK
jgi:hypothetical protein